MSLGGPCYIVDCGTEWFRIYRELRYRWVKVIEGVPRYMAVQVIEEVPLHRVVLIMEKTTWYRVFLVSGYGVDTMVHEILSIEGIPMIQWV